MGDSNIGRARTTKLVTVVRRGVVEDSKRPSAFFLTGLGFFLAIAADK